MYWGINIKYIIYYKKFYDNIKFYNINNILSIFFFFKKECIITYIVVSSFYILNIYISK